MGLGASRKQCVSNATVALVSGAPESLEFRLAQMVQRDAAHENLSKTTESSLRAIHGYLNVLLASRSGPGRGESLSERTGPDWSS